MLPSKLQTAADGMVTHPPFPPAQTALLLQLVRDIVTDHQIRPNRVLGGARPQRHRAATQDRPRPGLSVADHGLLDAPTRRVIAAFQMKHRPARFDGEPDAATAALLQVLAQPQPPAARR